MSITTPPFPIALRLSRFNRSSLAPVMAVIEEETPPGAVALSLLRSVDAFRGQGLLAYSFLSTQVGRVAEELALVNRHHPDALTLAGGAHASGDPAGALALGFRWVLVGEAGPELGRMVRSLLQGHVPPPGVITEPARLPLSRYPPWPRRARLFCSIEITRGCPIGCAFCQTPFLHGSRPRHRNLTELERIFEDSVSSGHSYTRFVTPNAFGYGADSPRVTNPHAVEGLLLTARRSGMKEVFLGTFPSEVRPESVTPELLGLIRALCDNRSIVVGLQSGSEEVLRRLGRGHTVEEGVQAVARIAHAGFLPRVDFIFGLPGETDSDRTRSRELIHHLSGTYQAQINTHVFTPLPGTPLAATRPTEVDPATRSLLESMAGRGKAVAVHRLNRSIVCPL